MISELFPPKVTSRQQKLFRGEIEYRLKPEMRDAFRITVRPDSCLAEGGKNGLLYACDLLDELSSKHGGIPCADYSDSPDLNFRCYHIDLKKGSGGVEDIKRTLKRLRQLRYNAVLIEYENRIRLDPLPGVEAADAFTHDEVRKIVRCAEENGLKVIPLLQSLGHLEYLLRLPAYRKYSESQTDFSQFCPLNDAAFELWKKAFDEMHSLHPDSEYFHIGGDETRQLGKCPACAEFVKDHSREELFFQHISRVCQYAVDHGVRPILWHDMLARSDRFDLIRRLPKETVLLYWEYISKEDSISRILFRERTLVSRDWIGRIHSFRDFTEAPKMFVGFIEDEPEELPETFREPAILPLLEPMRETGLTVWGASSLGYSPCSTLLSDTDRLDSNMRMWRDSGIEGIVVTRWASNDSLDAARGPASLRDLPLMMAAELMWNGTLERNELSDRYSCSFGTDTEQLAGLLDIMVYSESEQFFNWAEHAAPEFAALEKGINPQLMWLFRKYTAAMDAELLIRQIRSLIRNQSGQLAQSVFAQELRQRIPQIKQELRENFADEYPETSLEEWLKRLFEPYDAMFAGLGMLRDKKEDLDSGSC